MAFDLFLLKYTIKLIAAFRKLILSSKITLFQMWSATCGKCLSSLHVSFAMGFVPFLKDDELDDFLNLLAMFVNLDVHLVGFLKTSKTFVCHHKVCILFSFSNASGSLNLLFTFVDGQSFIYSLVLLSRFFDFFQNSKSDF